MNQVETIHETIEAANLKLKLRAGLEFELQERGNEFFYVIRDESTSNYYQIGFSEYTLLSLFDGSTSLQQNIEETSHRLGTDALTLHEAIRIAHWSIESGLAFSVNDSGTPNSDGEFFLDQLKEQNQKKALSRVNPLFIRVPLGDPSSFFKGFAPTLAWITSFTFLLVWLAVIGFGIVCLISNGAALTHSMLAILAPNAWGWLLITMILLKLCHEMAHGIFCQVYGGRVRETGLMLILFLPLPYVDVTSSWSFSSKWKRIAVAVAGMYVEIFLAALAAIAWSFCADPVWKFHLLNVVIMGSITTVLFNANFLMRFDGYYILSDLLEIPNLYQKGQQRISFLAKRFLLGVKERIEPESSGRNITIWTYGILAWAWRLLVCISICIVATSLLYGFGIALAILGLVIWMGMPILRFLLQWRDKSSSVAPNFGWITTVTAPVLACLFIVIYFSPWPVQVWAPALVEYRSPKIIRAESEGLVQSIHVQDGQRVKVGDLLLVLENQELNTRQTVLELERSMSWIRERSLRQVQDIAALKAERANRNAIEKELSEVRSRLKALVIRSTEDGVVQGDDLAELPGQYVEPGQGLMKIVDEEDKKITTLISQDSFEIFSNHSTQVAYFCPRYQSKIYSGTLGGVEPAANDNVDPRLTPSYGGELSVRRGRQQSRKSSTNDQSFRLVSSRFEGEIELEGHHAIELKAGTVGYVRLEKFNRTIGEKMSITLRKWWDEVANQIQQ